MRKLLVKKSASLSAGLEIYNNKYYVSMMEKQKTILVVEDEKSLREAIVDILRLKKFLPL